MLLENTTRKEKWFRRTASSRQCLECLLSQYSVYIRSSRTPVARPGSLFGAQALRYQAWFAAAAEVLVEVVVVVVVVVVDAAAAAARVVVVVVVDVVLVVSIVVLTMPEQQREK